MKPSKIGDFQGQQVYLPEGKYLRYVVSPSPLHLVLRQGRHGPSAQGGAAFAAHRCGGAAGAAVPGARGDRGRLDPEGGRCLGFLGGKKGREKMETYHNNSGYSSNNSGYMMVI